MQGVVEGAAWYRAWLPHHEAAVCARGCSVQPLLAAACCSLTPAKSLAFNDALDAGMKSRACRQPLLVFTHFFPCGFPMP